MDVLEPIGPWLGNISLVAVLFISLARGWLLTPAQVKRAEDSQEARILEALAREKEWKEQAQHAMKIVDIQGKQLEIAIEVGESVLKIVEALQNGNRKEGGPNGG